MKLAECRRTTQGTGSRVLALALVSSCLFAQGANLAHCVFVRHVICPEHGDLVHAEEASSAMHVTRASLGDTPDAPVLRGATAPEPRHGHDPCTILSDRRERASAPERPRTEQPPALTATAGGLEDWGPRAARIPLVLLAPKNSPPA